jgi:hypothetical protein
MMDPNRRIFKGYETRHDIVVLTAGYGFLIGPLTRSFVLYF